MLYQHWRRDRHDNSLNEETTVLPAGFGITELRVYGRYDDILCDRQAVNLPGEEDIENCIKPCLNNNVIALTV